MKKVLILLIYLFSSLAFAGDPNVKILMIGDSWAKLMCLDSSIDEALEHFSISAGVSCMRTSLMGIRAAQLNLPEKQLIIKKAFAEMKNIEVIILSIGGNDYFSELKANVTAEQFKEISAKIGREIKKNIEFIQAQKPNLKIIISGYDYANFSVLSEPNFLTNHYISMFNRAGRPTAEQLNNAFIEMNRQYVLLSREMSNVYFSNHMGMIHFYFGIPEHGIKKYATPFPGQYPDYNPLFGGDHRYGNTISALFTLPFDYKDFVDPYHLNKTGFKVIGEHLVGFYIRHMLSK